MAVETQGGLSWTMVMAILEACTAGLRGATSNREGEKGKEATGGEELAGSRE
jgi:hypothetical protein